MNEQPNLPLAIVILAAMYVVGEAAIRKEQSLAFALLRALDLR